MDSNKKIGELMTLLDMNDNLSNIKLTRLGEKNNNSIDERIKTLFDQLISGMYSSLIQEKEQWERWNRD